MPPLRITLREDYDANRLRRSARRSRDNRQTRRLLALAQDRQAQGPEEHHHHPAAVALARAQSGQERLAVPPPELALEPPRRLARSHQLHQHARLGASTPAISAASIRACPEKSRAIPVGCDFVRFVD